MSLHLINQTNIQGKNERTKGRIRNSSKGKYQYCTRSSGENIIMSSGNQMKNFEWSLKPIILSCLFCGIRLSTNQPQKWIYAKAISTFGVALLLLNLAFNGITFWHTFSKHVIIGKPVLKTGKVNDTASIINSLIGVFIITFLPAGVHLFFVWSSLLTSRLTTLWKLLLKIQEEMKLNHVFYKKCRKYCWIVLGLLILVHTFT